MDLSHRRYALEVPKVSWPPFAPSYRRIDTTCRNSWPSC